jgi:hypothetical protein
MNKGNRQLDGSKGAEMNSTNRTNSLTAQANNQDRRRKCTASIVWKYESFSVASTLGIAGQLETNSLNCGTE